jgi:hypothetical protein
MTFRYVSASDSYLSELCAIRWRVVIFDEFHGAKNPNSRVRSVSITEHITQGQSVTGVVSCLTKAPPLICRAVSDS